MFYFVIMTTEIRIFFFLNDHMGDYRKAPIIFQVVKTHLKFLMYTIRIVLDIDLIVTVGLTH